MDAETARNLITAAAGFGGAVIGAATTLVAGILQHRREAKNEASRESRLRAMAAAEKCHALFSEFVSAYEGCHPQADSTAFDDHMMRINGEIFTQVVFLPLSLRARINSARTVMVGADEIADGKYHYLPRATIVRYSARAAQELLVAYMRNEPIGENSLQMRELEIALTEHISDYSQATESKYRDFNEARTQFRKSHAELYIEAPRSGSRLRRRPDDSLAGKDD